MPPLADAVAATVAALGRAHLQALAGAYRLVGHYSLAAAARARSAVPAPHHDEVDRLNQAWATTPDATGAAVALAIEAARATQDRDDHPYVEVVATGPDSIAAPVRLTSEVVSQLIDQATKRVTLVSYAAYRIPAVVAALDDAAARGVSVNLILESPENLKGGGGAGAYARHRTYHWPANKREPPEAKLHAKAVIVDSRAVLLTSANMTAAAYDKNIELGILCRSARVATQIQRHFDGLITTGILEPAS